MGKHIYIHIPFCERKCAYCDFYSIEDHHLLEQYFDALRKEIAGVTIVPDVNPDTRDTVYFGGGTPTVPDANLLCDILLLVRKRFCISKEAEITIECNPNSVNYSKFLKYREAGFNRVSIGVQSLHDKTLKILGRLHDRERALESIEEAKMAGYENISCDLMIGVPSQTKDDILEDANILIDRGVCHISMYSLMIEEGTPFYDRYRNIEDFVDPDLERDMYHSLRDFLSANGLEPYEISNCGKMSEHNMSYWKGMEYYAFGAGSSGYLNGIRFSHPRSVKDYVKDPFHVDEEEKVGISGKMNEYMMLMLRTSDGPSKEEFQKRFNKSMDDVFANEIKRLCDQELIVVDDKGIRLTRKGLDLANQAFEEFV